MPKSVNSLAFHPGLKRNWGWLLGLGILFIILGCIGLGAVVGVTLVSVIVLGFLFLIAGVFQLVDTVKSKHWRGVVGHALVGLLYIVGGGAIIYDPFLASSFITALLAGILIAMGITRLLLAFALRHEKGWPWFLLAGLASLILGVLILAQWPWSGLWVIGLLIAIELLVNGWTYVFIALAIRKG